MHNHHLRVGRGLGAHVLEELRALLGRGPRAQQQVRGAVSINVDNCTSLPLFRQL